MKLCGFLIWEEETDDETNDDDNDKDDSVVQKIVVLFGLDINKTTGYLPYNVPTHDDDEASRQSHHLTTVSRRL
jgi:hypothetical protein